MTLPNEILIPQVGQLVKEGHTVTLPLRGFSMRPYLEDNRDCALLAAPPHQLRIGDVILAQTTPRRRKKNGTVIPPKYALHRVVALEGDIIIMCGDGNFTPEYVEYHDVLALAVGFYRKGSKKLDSCDSFLYQQYWKFWVWAKPVRKWMLLAWKLFHYPKDTAKNVIQKITKKT